MSKVFIGQIIHTKSLEEFILYTNGFVAVDENGKVVIKVESFILAL